jgi:hypothetical protein
MPSPLRIEMPAARYALAVHALRRAKRSWHDLDAALVEARQDSNDDLEAAWIALAALDRHLDRLAKLLAR